MENSRIEHQINQIARELLPGFSIEQSLLDQFDSLQIITLVTQVEEAFGVQLPAIDLSRENLESAAQLAALVGRYQTEK